MEHWADVPQELVDSILDHEVNRMESTSCSVQQSLSYHYLYNFLHFDYMETIIKQYL